MFAAVFISTLTVILLRITSSAPASADNKSSDRLTKLSTSVRGFNSKPVNFVSSSTNLDVHELDIFPLLGAMQNKCNKVLDVPAIHGGDRSLIASRFECNIFLKKEISASYVYKLSRDSEDAWLPNMITNSGPNERSLTEGQASHCKLLNTLGRSITNTNGVIIEVGTYVGFTTKCIGDGLQNQHYDSSNYHAFDGFMVGRFWHAQQDPWLKQHLGEQDMTERFKFYQKDTLPHINLYKGDIYKHPKWSGNDIMIFMTDAGKYLNEIQIQLKMYGESFAAGTMLAMSDFLYEASYGQMLLFHRLEQSGLVSLIAVSEKSSLAIFKMERAFTKNELETYSSIQIAQFDGEQNKVFSLLRSRVHTIASLSQWDNVNLVKQLHVIDLAIKNLHQELEDKVLRTSDGVETYQA